MSQTGITFSTTNTQAGLYTPKFGDTLLEIIPERTIVADMLSWSEAQKIGTKFQVPVKPVRSAGTTYYNGTGRVTYNNPISPDFPTAEVDSNVIVSTESVTQDALDRGAGGEVQYLTIGTALDSAYDNMAYRMELNFLFGQAGLAASTTNGTLVSAPSGGIRTITFPVATGYISGIFYGSEGAQFDIGADANSAAKNTQALTLTGVDDTTPGALTLTFTVPDGGEGTLANASTNTIWFTGLKSSTTWKESAGLAKLLQTTSGTLHGINVASYSLWRPRQYSAGSAALTFNKLMKAAVGPILAGLKDNLTVIVSPNTATDVLNEQSALRKYDYSYSGEKMKNGAKMVEFVNASGKLMRVVGHPYMWQGYGLILRDSAAMRVGPYANPCFGNGTKTSTEDVLWEAVPGTNYANVHVRYDGAVMLKAPAQCSWISAITNS